MQIIPMSDEIYQKYTLGGQEQLLLKSDENILNVMK